MATGNLTILPNNNTSLYANTGNVNVTVQTSNVTNNVVVPQNSSTTLYANILSNNGVVVTANTYGNANVAAYLPTYSGNVSSAGLGLSGIFTDNYYYANGAPISFSGTYGNANVAAYLPTYTGNLTAATISATGNITGSYFLGNGAFLTGLPATYGNANVADYLPTYTGNLTAYNISAGGNIQSDDITSGGNITATGNIQGSNLFTSGVISATGNINTDGAVSAVGNVSGNYILGNGSQLTGIAGSYGNANVAAYLPTYGGNILVNTITGNNGIRANIHMIGTLLFTSTGGNIGADQGASPNKIFANELILQGGVTQEGGISSYGPISTLAGGFGQASDILSAGKLSALGNVETLNTVKAGVVSAVGNIIGGNIRTVGVVSATGNVTGNYFIGNGAFLTGLSATYSNANVAAYLPVYSGNILANTISTTGQIFAANGSAGAPSIIFSGDIAQDSGLYLVSDGNIGVSINATQRALFDTNGISINGNVLASGSVYAFELNSTEATGDEGGQINLANAVTNTTLVGNIVIDVYRNKLRFWEGGGNNRGAYIDLSEAAINVGTNLLDTSGAVPGGSNTYVQFNDDNAFGGNAQFTYNKATDSLRVGNVVSDSNGGGTNFQVGDDAWLGDINQSDTIGLKGIQSNGTQAYIVFGNSNGSKLGRNGTGPLTYDDAFSATGNISTANYFVGNGAYLTGIVSSYGNSNVADYLPVYGGNILANTITSTDGISAAGNVSGLLLLNTGNIIRLGTNAGNDTTSGFDTVAIGRLAGNSSQGVGAIAIGVSAGNVSQGGNAIAIGRFAAATGPQGANAIAFGRAAGNVSQGAEAIAIGRGAGNNLQGANAIAFGTGAGVTTQGIDAIAIGRAAGSSTQGLDAIAIGRGSAQSDQGVGALAIGIVAGNISQGANAVAIGRGAGFSNQGANALAFGFGAGQTNQSANAVAIGFIAGNTNQGGNAVALGYNAGYTSQGDSAVAIGRGAGETTQGNNAVAIGWGAGRTSQAANSIAIGTNGNLVAANEGFYVNPVRNDTGNTANVVYFNAATNELTYAPATGGTYGNANVAAYLPTDTTIISIQSNVANNTSNISTLTSDLANTNANVANNTSNISTLTSGLANTNANVSNLANIVASNSNDIITLQSEVYANANVAAYLPTYTGNITANIISAIGNVTGSYIKGDGSQLTNLPVQPGTYGNANVAAYLPTYTGDITASTVTATGNINGSYILGNGSQLTGIISSYGNSNVANYLPTYTGNITAGNIDVAHNVSVFGNVTFGGAVTGNLLSSYIQVANITILSNVYAGDMVSATGTITTQTAVTTTGSGYISSNTFVQAQTYVSAIGNINGAYINGNGAFLTGLPATYGNSNVAAYLPTDTTIIGIQSNVSNNASNITTLQGQVYTNANVAAYLPTYTGDITASTVTATGNISGSYILGNGSQLTGLPSTYGNAQVAAFLPTYTGNIGNTGNSVAVNLVNYKDTVYAYGNATGTITPDAANGSIQNMTLTGNITLNAFGGTPQAGQQIVLKLTQDATGNRILTSTMKWAGGFKTLSTTANAIDIATVWYDGSAYWAALTRGYA